MKKSIYVAGPMRGYPEFNFPAFFAASDYLRDKGWFVFNPAERDVNVYKFNPIGLEGTNEELKELNFDLRRAMDYNCYCICNADAIYLLAGWELSEGARAEVALANLLGLQILAQENGD